MPSLRRTVWMLVSLALLSVIDALLGTTKEGLGWWYWPYIIISTGVVMAIVWHYVPTSPPQNKPDVRR